MKTNKKKLTAKMESIIRAKITDAVAPYKGKRREREAWTQFLGASLALETLGYQMPPVWAMNMMSGRIDRLIGTQGEIKGLDTRMS